MADITEQSDKANSPQFSDETIRRFLFGRLSAAEQSTFEETLFADDALETRVRLTECELADDYVFERLSDDDQELFEQRFLVSAARQQKLSVSRALRDRFASAPAVATATTSLRTTIGERLQRFLVLNKPSWKPALSMLILIALAGTVWVILRKPLIRERLISQTKQLIPRRRPAPVQTPGANQQEAHHTAKAPTPPPAESPTALSSRLVVETVALAPESTYDRDRIRSVTLSQFAPDILSLRLTLVNSQPGTYRAELLTIAGQSVFTEGSRTPAAASGSIDFDVPVRFLSAGDYQVKLSRVTEGIEEGVATYYFRVQ
jgi:hypothetical protein